VSASSRLVILALGVVVAAASPALAAERTHQIDLDDYFTIAAATSCVQSPKGTYVAWTEMRWEKENDKRNTDLWVVTTATRDVRRLTFEPEADGSAQWSPDEAWIYFTTSRKQGDDAKAPYNGKKQVWRVSPQGGELFPVTRLEDGVDDFRLSADGKTLYYTAKVSMINP